MMKTIEVIEIGTILILIAVYLHDFEANFYFKNVSQTQKFKNTHEHFIQAIGTISR